MMKELRVLNKYFYKYKYHFIFGIVITIIAQIFALYTPIMIGKSMKVIEEFFNSGISTEGNEIGDILFNYLLILIGAALIRALCTFFMRQTLIVMSRHIEFDLKNEIYNHYQYLTQAFYKKNRTGDLMNRVSSDVDKVRQYTGPAVMYGINTSITFIVVIVQMYLISPELTFYTLIPLPLLSYSIFKLSTEINKKSTIYQQNLSALATFTQEIFSGIRIIKAHNIEENIQSDFKELSNQSKNKNMKLAKLNSLFGPLMVFLIGVSNLLVIIVGGLFYINGKILHVGVIAEFILYVNMLTWPVASLGWISSMVQEAEASQKRINEFLRIKPEILNSTDLDMKVQGSVEFKNVDFTYEDTGIKALTSFSLKVNKGQKIAILGKTGSGKSTVLSLISRLYDVDSGEVFVDGINVKEYNLRGLRDQIAVVPQDAFLFSDSIKNNIKFGKEDATDQEIIKYAELAVVHDNIVNFKDGYNTILGERGISLSGGQKQRVSIARALIKDAPILLLDDSLSAVDTETEELILTNLEKIAKDKTTFIVSHRVSAARNSDIIIILDKGRIVQQGTHNELISVSGYYKDLYYKQMMEKEIL